jgi:hypothetical protein
MTLANMRMNGVRAVIATCEGCGHKADVSVDALPETIVVPEAGRCSDAASVEGSESIPDPRGIQCDPDRRICPPGGLSVDDGRLDCGEAPA